MTINDALRGLGGFFTLASVALGYWVHPGFFLFTAFVGANLLQSAFTKTCPMVPILKKLGLKETLDQPQASCCAEKAA
ncbi:MAG TPA: DUF2892 domain-containing protein [Thermoanaerobaculia bacterium]|nr:DUF2892 domain-containing protein [Thermoanaerobaculia bacterium]